MSNALSHANLVLPDPGAIGFYRPDPGHKKSPNIVLADKGPRLTVFEVPTGMVFEIDREDWMNVDDFRAHITTVQNDPRYSDDQAVRERLLDDYLNALCDAVRVVPIAPTLMRQKATAGTPRLEDIASKGSVVIEHDRARGMHSNGYAITVKDGAGAMLIGTVAHADEMDDLVGPVLASTLRTEVETGQYTHCLSSVEIMGIRGSLPARIEAGPVTPNDAGSGEKFVVMCAVSGGVTGSREKPMSEKGRIMVFDTHGAAEAEAVKARKSMAHHRGLAQFSYWVAPATADILAHVQGQILSERGRQQTEDVACKKVLNTLVEFIGQHGEWWNEQVAARVEKMGEESLTAWIDFARSAKTPDMVRYALSMFVTLVDTKALEWDGESGDWEPILLDEARRITGKPGRPVASRPKG